MAQNKGKDEMTQLEPKMFLSLNGKSRPLASPEATPFSSHLRVDGRSRHLAIPLATRVAPVRSSTKGEWKAKALGYPLS